MKKLNFIDLFSGIGGFRMILEKEQNFDCLAFSEINKTAIEFYKKNFNKEDISLGDIKEPKDLTSSIDLMTAGVPCQAWSTAGKNQGFNDPRGQLWFHTFKALDKYKPTMFIFENVKGLTDPRNLSSLELIKEEISKRGYFFKIFILNSNDFGTPQERIRLFIVGTKNKEQFERFGNPTTVTKKPSLNKFLNLGLKNTTGLGYVTFTDVRNGNNTIHSWDLITTTKREKYICLLILKNRRKKKFGSKDGNPLSLAHIKSLDSSVKKDELEILVSKNILIKRNNFFEFKNSKISSGINGIYRVYSPNSQTFSTLTATGMKDFISTECFISREEFIKKIFLNKKYRQITSKEALLLQGFPDDFILPEKYNKWMKLVGNSVPLHSIREMVKIIMDSLKIQVNL